MATSSPRILITRAANGNSELAEKLCALGAEPILIPAIEITDPSDFAPLDQALKDLAHFHWLLFTSANAVEPFAQRLKTRVPHAPAASPSSSEKSTTSGASRKPSPDPTRPKIAAIGSATARALEQIGLKPDLIPPQAVAESLLAALLPVTQGADGTPTRFLLVRAEEARELLPESLRAAGAEVTVAPAYRTVIPSSSVTQLGALFADREQPVAAITFTSSSTARNLLALCERTGVPLPPNALRISIGPITSATLRELGLPPDAEAPEATVQSLAETVMAALAHPPSKPR